jgi:predicted RNA-binding protein YlqC (UPF0109 family)
MPDMDQEFVEYVVKALVANPEDVHVRRSVDDMGVLRELTVNTDDMGKVICKAGATAKSIRTLLRVLGSRSDARVNLKIIEPEGARLPEGANDSPEAAPAAAIPPADRGHEPDDPEAARQADLLARTKSEFDDLDDLDL